MHAQFQSFDWHYMFIWAIYYTMSHKYGKSMCQGARISYFPLRVVRYIQGDYCQLDAHQWRALNAHLWNN